MGTSGPKMESIFKETRSRPGRSYKVEGWPGAASALIGLIQLGNIYLTGFHGLLNFKCSDPADVCKLTTKASVNIFNLNVRSASNKHDELEMMLDTFAIYRHVLLSETCHTN